MTSHMLRYQPIMAQFQKPGWAVIGRYLTLNLREVVWHEEWTATEQRVPLSCFVVIPARSRGSVGTPGVRTARCECPCPSQCRSYTAGRSCLHLGKGRTAPVRHRNAFTTSGRQGQSRVSNVKSYSTGSQFPCWVWGVCSLKKKWTVSSFYGCH